jgi:hypothetical protein
LANSANKSSHPSSPAPPLARATTRVAPAAARAPRGKNITARVCAFRAHVAHAHARACVIHVAPERVAAGASARGRIAPGAPERVDCDSDRGGHIAVVVVIVVVVVSGVVAAAARREMERCLGGGRARLDGWRRGALD